MIIMDILHLHLSSSCLPSCLVIGHVLRVLKRNVRFCRLDLGIFELIKLTITGKLMTVCVFFS